MRYAVIGPPNIPSPTTCAVEHNTLELVPRASATPVQVPRYCTAFGVRQVSDMHAAGLLAPLGRLAARLLGKRLADDLRRAKRLLEAASPTAQDTPAEEA